MPYLEIHQKDDDKQTLVTFVEKNFKQDETRKVIFMCSCLGHYYKRLLDRDFDCYSNTLYQDGFRVNCCETIGFYYAKEGILRDILAETVTNITIKITNDENMD